MPARCTDSETPRRTLGPIRAFLTVVAWLGVLACLIALLLGRLGAEFWALDLFNHFRPWYVLGLTLGTLVFLLARAWRSAIFSGVVGLVIAATLAPWFLPSDTDHDGPAITLAHANVLVGNPNPDEVFAQLLGWSPDIIGLQEVNASWADRLSRVEGYEVAFAEAREDSFGIALLVRADGDVLVQDVEVLRLGEPHTNIGAIACTVTTDIHEARLLYIHTLPPVNTEYALARDTMLHRAGDWVTEQSGECIVLGDLNATVWSVPMQRMVDDASLENALRGQGFGASWPSDMPRALRIGIDHCLHTSGIVTTDHELGAALGSDHLPLRVELAWE